MKHGMADTRLHKIWIGFRQRCNNPNDQAYKWYGAKGVSVCAEWNESFIPFMEWALANGYRNDLTLDRLESDKNYEPSNCRWITRAENTRRAQKGKTDRGSNEPISFNGESLTIQEWAAKLGLKYQTLYNRLYVRKMPLAKALTPKRVSIAETYTYQGETRTLREWAKKLGMKVDTLDQRLNRLHWPIEQAFTKRIRARGGIKNKVDTANVTAFGETRTLSDWADYTGISYMTLYQRLDKGWSEEDALSKPVRPKKSRK